jgi:hypothetical protein
LPSLSTRQMIGEAVAPNAADSSATTVALACPSPSVSTTRPAMTPVRASLKPIPLAGAATVHFSVSGSQPNFDARRK